MSTKDYVRELRALIGTSPVNLVGAAGVVLDSRGELLLQRKRGADRWTVPGGICELGEAFEDTLRRELREETALTVERAELLGVVSGEHTFKRIGNGDEFFMYTAVYLVRGWSGTPTPDGEESEELRFFPLGALPPLAAPVTRWAADWMRDRAGMG